MGWQEDHQRRVAGFPHEIRDAHRHSLRHRPEIQASDVCGCFYCCSIFPSGAIGQWVDEDEEGVGQTALCPNCGIDSVIGSKSPFTIDLPFLKRMQEYWF